MNSKKLFEIAEEFLKNNKIEYNNIQNVFLTNILPTYNNDSGVIRDGFYTQEGLVIEYSDNKRFNKEKEIARSKRSLFPQKEVINSYRYCVSNIGLTLYLLERI